MAEYALSLQGRGDELFKDFYGPISENVYNSANVLLGRIKKSYKFGGREFVAPVPLGFAGGFGASVIPKSNTADYDQVRFGRKKLYTVARVDRETVKASTSNEMAWLEGFKEATEKAVEEHMRNMSRMLFGDGTGALAVGDAATNVTGTGTGVDPYIVVLGTTTNDANIENRSLINYHTETSELEIVDYNVTTRAMSLVGTSIGLAALTGGGPVPATRAFYMQNSKDQEMQGLKGVCDATAGTLYGVPVQRRWQATRIDAAGKSLSTDLINQIMLEIERKCQVPPKMIVTSYVQQTKLLNLLESDKVYNLPARAENLKGLISFAGIEFMSTRGPIGVFADRFCDADRMYFINDDHIEIMHAQGWGWFDDDGTVWLRAADRTDEYEAVYGGYAECYIKPTFQGVIYNLATA